MTEKQKKPDLVDAELLSNICRENATLKGQIAILKGQLATTTKKKYKVTLTQSGYGRLQAKCIVEAEDVEMAEEEAYEQDLDWKVTKFNGDGYDIENVEEI